MLLNALFLVGGLALILLGANLLTDGASSVAHRWGVSDLIIGLTVVAFGTSVPELVISMLSALNGNAEIAIGNVVGSNILNILLIIGITAVIRPMSVGKGLLRNDLPLVILSSLAICAMGFAPLLNGEGIAQVSRVDGILLLLFFAIFMRYTFVQAANQGEEAESVSAKQMSLLKATIWIVGGLAALVVGGDRFVEGASGLARSWGVSEAVIGLTIVAVGTSMPELATSVVAALKGRNGMAIGNVVGSNIFNAFFVLGASATIRPLPFGGIGAIDLGALIVASVAFWLVGQFGGKRTITRLEGVLLLLLYAAYLYLLLKGV